MSSSTTQNEQENPVAVFPSDGTTRGVGRSLGVRAVFAAETLVVSMSFVGLYLLSQYSYLLFHSIVEVSSIVVASCVFLIGWLSVRFTQNRLYLFLGVTYLVSGVVDLLHTLAYKGMTVFVGYDPADPNLATQLWLVARYLQSMGLLLAPLFVNRRLPRHVVIPLFFLAAALPVGAVFDGVFPAAFAEGHLTPFKIGSEYVICAILVLAYFNYRRIRQKLDPMLDRWFSLSIVFTIAAELSFTTYTDPYGITNALGHFFKVLSFLSIFRYLVMGTLMKPYTTLFNDLDRKRRSLADINDILVLSNTLLRHDMRHSLSVIRMSLDLYSENHVQSLMTDALIAVDQAGELITSVAQMEELAISGGGLNPCSAHEAAQRAVVGCKLPYSIKGDCIVMADMGLEYVIRNLVRNAEIHSQTDRIAIAIDTDGQWCEIRVSDWGIGMEEGVRQRAFEKGVKSKLSKGLGLGLYVVKKTVERYGGDVRIESNSPRGTVIVLRLRDAHTTVPKVE